MKHIKFSLALAFLLLPVGMLADEYETLWKKVEQAAKKDLPRTEITHLQTIIDKAGKDKNYGQMLKAEWRKLWAWHGISPDSTAVNIERLERKAETYKDADPALAAVCYAALGKTCDELSRSNRTMADKAQEYYKKAMACPDVLAAKRADAYEPFSVEGRDAALFGNDLLSLVGYVAKDYVTMHRYYSTTDNRTATLLTALDMLRDNAEKSGQAYVRKPDSPYMLSLDSLINLYSDLPACGEVAIEKCNLLSRTTGIKPETQVDYINEALQRWGAWPRIETLRNALKELTCPMFRAFMEQRAIPTGGEGVMPVSVRNVDKLTLTLTRVAVDGSFEGTPQTYSTYKELLKKAVDKSVRTYTKTYAGRADYEVVEDSFVISGLPLGVYLLELSADDKSLDAERRLLHVTDLFILSEALPNNKTRFAVVNANTGQPVGGARLVVKTNRGKQSTLTCDANGEIVYSHGTDNVEMARAYTAGDTFAPYGESYNRFYYYGDRQADDRTNIFTDRKIYRPGQTVHVAVIARNVAGDVQKALQGKALTLSLRDANNKLVAEKSVATDAYGTASADFVLPSSGLTGNFSVRSNGAGTASAWFSVEEYKRPTFEVEFPEITEKYANGDTITVKGYARSYSGVAVQGAKVKYNVIRRQAYWWRGYGGGSDVLASGETVTDGDGAFFVKMPMCLPVWEDEASGMTETDYYRIARFYTFTADATVTDQAGESHVGEISLPLGSKPVAFGCDLPGKTVRDSLKTITFTLKNAAGNDIDGTVTYTIDGQATTYTAAANKPVEAEWNTAATLKSGKHSIVAVCGTDTLRQDFIVFGMDDTAPCVETPDWFYISSDKFNSDGAPVYLQFGSSDADVHVLYTVISDDKVLKSGTLDMGGEVVTRKLTYKPEYGNGLLVNLAWVKDGKAYIHNARIGKPLPDKRLIVKWTSFRDRLTPGQQEEWTLNITRPDGTPADAQLMVTLYDASLDQLRTHSWPFHSFQTYNLPSTSWRKSQYYGQGLYSSAKLDLPSVPQLDFGYLAAGRYWSVDGSQVLITRDELVVEESKTLSLMMMSSAPKMLARSNASGNAYTTSSEEVVAEDAVGGYGAGEHSTANVSLRENFNETAFFYPALLADSLGNVVVKFTLPESVTTWRFMGFAHDKEMNNGQIDGNAVAKKTVMVQPNMPRFVRVGDKVLITTRIFNTSENAVKGTAVMQMIDPETEKMVVEVKKKFGIEADTVGVVSFNYHPDANRSLLVCKIFAEGEGFSDGEQHYLPVLPDAELVTTTVPFTLHGTEVKSIDLKPLFPEGGRDERLTVEFTGNPAWMMVQSLPFINNAREDNAISLAAAYYANSLGAYIMKQSPKIKSVFEQWKREEGQQSLMGSLERNTELKNIVLDETPWVADAGLEADQKQMLASYFDESNLGNNINTTLEKLRKLQNANDGSWCWWQGMPYGSASLTASIVEMLVRLNGMTGGDKAAADMAAKGAKFLGGIAVKDVRRYKENEKAGKPYSFNETNAVRYLYICALGGIELDADEREAADFLLVRLKERGSSLNLYDKALMAVVLAKRGERQLAEEYVKSLEEYSVVTEEMGRYYDAPRAAYSWFDYRIPTQVAAIEAMTLIAPEEKATGIDEMKRWLLQQKRVQGWDTPINSVNAVYAFLNGNTAVLENNAQPTISLDGKPLELPKATAGLGYVKTVADHKDADVFTAEKTTEGTAWGAVYAQSVQKTSAVATASAGFTVTREIVGADGKPATSLKVGDRVKVRVTIIADRDYDYVTLNDRRAACMEPVRQLSGYRNGSYCTPKDNATDYFFDRMTKGTHVVETEYYIDRAGVYETGTCNVQCCYAPEYSARAASITIKVGD